MNWGYIAGFLDIRETREISMKGTPKDTWKPGISFGEEETLIYEEMKKINLAGGKAH